MNSNERLEEIWNEVKEIKKLLSGNGEIGFCERVRNTEKRLDNFENKTITIWSKIKLIASTIFYIGGAVGVIFASVKYILTI